MKRNELTKIIIQSRISGKSIYKISTETKTHPDKIKLISDDLGLGEKFIINLRLNKLWKSL